jgi:tetratricopeptide (TPR) repeat protein
VLAINNLDTAIQLEPDNANYRCSRGRMHSQLGAYEEAMKDLDHALKVDPTNSDYLHWRGNSFWFLSFDLKIPYF